MKLIVESWRRVVEGSGQRQEITAISGQLVAEGFRLKCAWPGNRRQSIFDDRDRLRFLETLGQSCDRYGLVVHGYCLMPNHNHLTGIDGPS